MSDFPSPIFDEMFGQDEDSALMLPRAWDLPGDLMFPAIPLRSWQNALDFSAQPEIRGREVHARIAEWCAQPTTEHRVWGLASAYREQPRTRNTIVTLLSDEVNPTVYVPIYLAMLAQGEAPIQTALAIHSLAPARAYDEYIVASLRLHWSRTWFPLHALKALADTVGLPIATQMLDAIGVGEEERNMWYGFLLGDVPS